MGVISERRFTQQLIARTKRAFGVSDRRMAFLKQVRKMNAVKAQKRAEQQKAAQKQQRKLKPKKRAQKPRKSELEQTLHNTLQVLNQAKHILIRLSRKGKP